MVMPEENEEELLERIKSIEKKINKIDRETSIGLEDQLFFGLIVSMALFFLALPFTESIAFFQNIFQLNYAAASGIAEAMRNIFVLSLICSTALRYYGAVKPHRDARLWSIMFLLFSFDMFLMNFMQTLTINVFVKVDVIIIPFSYLFLMLLYVLMGKFLEPKLLRFYAKKDSISKRYVYPIVSRLFVTLTAIVYCTIAVQVLALVVFRTLTSVENLIAYLLFSLFFFLSYLLNLVRNEVIDAPNFLTRFSLKRRRDRSKTATEN